MKAVIVGAGIGGICCALALAKRGWDVQVLERAQQIADIGAGIQISPNGVKVLAMLGVMPHLEKTLFEPDAIEMRMGQSGRRIFSLPMKPVATRRWGARYVQLHRADLLSGLMRALSDQCGDVVEMGAVVTGYETPKTPRVMLGDGSHIDADLIVGADGIRSSIRAQMIGPDAPRFTGNYAWRSVVPIERLGTLAPPPNGCIWAGANRHAVTTRVRAGTLVNFVGIVETDAQSAEGWTTRGARVDALVDFAGWQPTITNIIENTDEIYRWALYDRAPLQTWSQGNVILLGDAAHPMLPSMAQGGVQAIEDAFVLAKLLDSAPNIEDAGAQFFETRINRTARIQDISTKNLHLFHRANTITQFASYAPIWLAGHISPSIIHRRNDWIYGMDVTD